MDNLVIKNKDNLVDVNDNATKKIIEKLDPSKLPSVINEQIVQVKVLSKKIKDAEKKANESKKAAEAASKTSAGIGHKKEAIESLQGATKQIAEAHSDTVETMKLSFAHQEKLAEITKYLFALGVYSVANTRIVIQELAEALKEEGNEEAISDVAREQLMSVINQLQAQGEIREKQEDFDSKLDEHSFLIENIENQLEEVEKIDISQDEKIEHNAEVITEHEQALSEQQKKDAEHDEKFAENDLRDSEQDERIEHNAEVLTEHEQALSVQQRKDAEHDEKFAENDLRDSEQDERISSLKSELEAYKIYIKKQMDELYVKTERDNDDVIGLIEDYQVDNQKKFDELTAKIDQLETTMKKKVWKIVVSIGVGASLLLNLLQILGVL